MNSLGLTLPVTLAAYTSRGAAFFETYLPTRPCLVRATRSYDILSVESHTQRRCIEVKTTNGAYGSSFIVSRNELDFSQEAGDEFFLYRVFDFRQMPGLYILRGDISKHVHLEALDYRASFRRLAS